MQSTDEHMISPYSTSPFTGSFSAPCNEPPAFHRYQHGDLVGPWFAASDPEQQAHSGQLGDSSMEQRFDYQILGPYMIAQPSMYGQGIVQEPASMSSQQIQSQFSPNLADHPGTPAPSPSNNGVPGVHYRNSPGITYVPQQTRTVPIAMPYSSPGTSSYPADYSARREGHRPATASLYRDGSAVSLDSAASSSFPPGPPQSGQQIFTFIAPQVGGAPPSESSSFTSDSGTASQQRSQKVPKKRASGTTTRRPRKPPLEAVVEPKLQKAPEISRNAPRTTSPKRARTEVSQTDSSTAVETTPDSVRTVSPGTISKAHIGQQSRASPGASQQHKAAGRTDAPKVPYSEESHSDNSKFLSQKLKEFIEENQSLNKRADELDKDVQRLKHENAMLSRQAAELKKDVRDMKCKVLESLSGGDTMRDDSPRADAGWVTLPYIRVSMEQTDADDDNSVVNGVGQQAPPTAYTDLRRPSTSSIVTSSTASTALSSRRNSPADTVYSNQDSGLWYNPPNGLEHNGAGTHPIHSNVYQARQ